MLGVAVLASIMKIPYAIMTPFVIVISILGSYALQNSMTDVWVTIIFGFLGFWLRKAKYPLAPLVVAIVLGDSTERELRRSMIMSGGSLGIFFSTPLAGIVMAIAIVLFLVPAWEAIRKRLRPAPVAAKE